MRVTRLVELLSGSTATTLNLLLIPIILFKSSQRIGRYKYFLLAYTFNACLLSTSQFTALPTWYIPANGYFFISTVDILPRWIQQCLIYGFVCGYTGNTIILTWCFLYRLAAIESARPWITTKKYFSIALLLSILLAAYIIYTCTLIMPTTRADAIFRDEILTVLGIETSDVGYIGGEITVEGGSLNIGMAVCLFSCAVFVFSACFTMRVCWHKIGSKLREMRHMANCNYKFQYKLYVLLTLQTCMPIVFNIFPGFIAFILGLFKIPCGDVILIGAMVVSFAQIVDPIFTVLLISDYKDVFLRFHVRTCRMLGMEPSFTVTTKVSTVTARQRPTM